MRLTTILLLAALVGLALAGTHEAGRKWLDEKAKEEGVVSLPSGLMYKVLRSGTGVYHPTVDSPCDCHYEGTLINGEEFDSSYARGSPTTFAPNQVIKGWTEAMQLMVEGDKWEMYIPSELGYGDGGSGAKIKGGDPLVFRMEIIKIKGGKKRVGACDPATLTACNKKETEFVTKHKDSDLAAMQAELEKLTNAATEGLKASVQDWITRRKVILEKMIAAKGGKTEL